MKTIGELAREATLRVRPEGIYCDRREGPFSDTNDLARFIAWLRAQRPSEPLLSGDMTQFDLVPTMYAAALRALRSKP